jgi:oxygen-independent coproporphyrinogen-3 oxidase
MTDSDNPKPKANGPNASSDLRPMASPQFATYFPKLGDPRSAYVHIPFCRHRCGYCNFTLVAGRDYLIERFLNTLTIEIQWLDQTYELDTLFLGGGTPSHLSPKQLDQLAQTLNSRFEYSDAEVTAECNPNDLDESTMEAFAKLGVNRISLGVQSFSPTKLKTLERDHTPDDIRRAVSVAKQFGAAVSMDLIFAAPEESDSEWQQDLEIAISLQPDHVSTYELTYEKGTQFWNRLHRGNIEISDEDLRATMYSTAIERLAESGFEQYEVSSFAQPNSQCQHNQAYWIGDPFFAFGPGAARLIDGRRETNHQSTTRYLKLIESNQSPVADSEFLSPEESARERLAIGLRMATGVDEVTFKQRTSFDVAELLSGFETMLIENDLLVHDASTWRLTQSGLMVCDWIATKIVCG